MTATTPLTGADCMRLAADLRAQFRHLLYLLRSMSEHHDLSAVQVSTLNALAERSRRVGEIARLNGVRMPSATEQVTRLEREGLVRRTQDPTELRAVLVDLTVEGRARLRSVNEQRDALLAARLARLPRDQRDALAAALPALEALAADQSQP